MAGIYWVFLMINRNFGGYVPPGRWLFPIFWILALFVARLYAEAKTGIFSLIKWGTALPGFILAGYALSRNELLFEKTLTRGSFDLAAPGEFMLSLGNSFMDIKRFVPKMTDFFTSRDLALPVWLIVAVAITWLSLKKETSVPAPWPSLRRLAGGATAVMGISLAFLTYTFWNVRLDSGIVLTPEGPAVHFQDDNHYGPELTGFWTKPERTAFLILESSVPLTAVRVDFSSPVDGATRLRVGRLTKKLLRRAANGVTSWTVRDPVGYKRNGKYLYSLGIREENGFVPAQVEPQSKDRRKLGVFVRISAQSPSRESADVSPRS